MLIEYNEFEKIIKKHIKDNKNYLEQLLINIINNPIRYIGNFRLTNFKNKLIQNILQSNEIKFGDILEELIYIYLEKVGYEHLDNIFILMTILF